MRGRDPLMGGQVAGDGDDGLGFILEPEGRPLEFPGERSGLGGALSGLLPAWAAPPSPCPQGPSSPRCG